jgi:hypothetical protein
MGYSFCGTNSSMEDFSNQSSVFDLSDIPSQPTHASPSVCSLLVCPMQLSVWSANVVLSPGGSLDIALQRPSNSSTTSSLTLLTTQTVSLGPGITEVGSTNVQNQLSAAAISVFLADLPAADLPRNYYKLNSLTTINENLNSHQSSIMKAFASGYINSTYTNTTTVTGQVLIDRLALSAGSHCRHGTCRHSSGGSFDCISFQWGRSCTF